MNISHKKLETTREKVLKNTGGLDNSAFFNPDLRVVGEDPGAELFNVIGRLAKELRIPTGPKLGVKANRNLETLVCNLIVASADDEDRYLAFSQRNGDYTSTGKFSPLTRGVIKLVKKLHEHGYVFKHNGYKSQSQGRLARIKGTRKFRKLFKNQSGAALQQPIQARPDDLIVLRRKKGKDTITVPRNVWESQNPPELNQELKTLETLCGSFNALIAQSEIQYLDADGRSKMLFPHLYRVFSERFSRGGRYYCGYGGHQNLPKSQRSTIKLDGKPTVELDYGGLSLRMLYHLNGEDFMLDRDPYMAALEAMGCSVEIREDGKPIDPGMRILRKDMKVMLLSVINDTCTQKQAISRANRRLFASWHDVKNHAKKQFLKSECENRERLWRKYDITVEGVLQGFYKAHRPIEHEFSSGCGIRLQRLDSDMATAILFALKMLGIVCLPIHDSFIVPEDKEEVLRNVMRLTYDAIIKSQLGDKSRDAEYLVPIR